MTTDNTYLRRYNFNNDNVLTNRLFTEKVWDRNYASLNGYAFQGLRQSDHQDQIPFAVPWGQTELKSEPWRWGSRFTLDSSLLTLTRINGLDTRRLSTTGGWEAALGQRARRPVPPDAEPAGRRLLDRRRSRDLERQRRQQHRGPRAAAADGRLELALDRRHLWA